MNATTPSNRRCERCQAFFRQGKTNEGICVLLRQVVRVEHVCSYFAAKSPAPVAAKTEARKP